MQAGTNPSGTSPGVIGQVLEAALDAVVVIDDRGIIRYWNPQAERTFGWSASDAMGRELGALAVPPKQRAAYAQALQSFSATGQTATLRRRFEVTALRKDGTEFPAEVTVSPVRLEDRMHLAGFVRDRSGPQGMEAALRESEARFRALAEGIPQFVWSAGPDGMVDYANESWNSYTGQTDETVKGTGWAAALHPDDFERSKGVWLKAVTSGQRYEVEFRLRRASDGVYRWFLSRAWPRRSEDGRVLQWLGTCTDIDDHKRALDALQMQASVLENMAEGVCVTDEAGRIQYANPALESMFGAGAGQLAGSPLEAMSDPGRPMAAVLERLRSDASWSGELRQKRLNGSRFWSYLRISALTVSGRRLLVCVQEDVTARRQAERAQAAQRVVAETLAFSESVEEAVPAILGTLGETFDCRTGAFWRAGAGGELRAIAVWSRPEAPAPAFESQTRALRLAVGEGLPGQVIERGEPRWLTDLDDGAGLPRSAAARTDGLRSGLVVPVLLGDRRLGVLEFYSGESRAKDEATLELAASVGSHLAQFLERKLREEELREMNTTLERRVRERTEQLERRENMLLQAEELAHLGSWEWDVAGGTLTWTDELYRIYGLDRAAFRPSFDGFLARLHPDDRDRVEGAIRKALEEGGGLDHEERIVRPDGSVRILRSRSRTVVDPSGRVRRMFGTCLDVTEQKAQEQAALQVLEERARSSEAQAAEELARFMSHASEHLFASLDHEATLRQLARLAVPRLGNWASVHLVEDDGTVRNIALAHEDPEKIRQVEELLRRYPPPPDSPHGAHQVIRTGRSELLAEVGEDILREAAVDDGHLELLRGLGLTSALTAPIRSGDRVIGAISVCWAEPGKTYSARDQSLLEDLARRAGSAVENARLHRRAEEARREAETLNGLGQTLAGELDLTQLVQAVTDAGTQICGAQFGAFFYNVVGEKGESYTLYTLSGVPREKFSRFPTPRNTPLFGPTFRGEGVIRVDDVTRDGRYGKMAPHYGMPAGHLPVKSYLAVPVKSRSGKVLGGLFFGHEAPGRFKASHERLLLGLAAQAAIGIDNAHLYDQARREVAERTRAQELEARRARQALLGAQVGQALTTAATIPEMLERSAQAMVDALDAAFARFWTLGEKEPVLELQASAGIPVTDDAGPAASAASAVARIAGEGRPHLTNDVPSDPSVGDPGWARREGVVAFAGYPLRVEGRVIGVLALGARRPLSDDVLHGLAAIADSVSVGIERKRKENELRDLNVRLEERVHARTAELQAANRELESFSYSVSHDLRGPLRSMDGYSQVLLRKYADRIDETGRGYLGKICSATERMGRLIDDFLSLSKLTRSPLALAPVDVSALAAEVAGELDRADPARRVQVKVASGMRATADPRLLRVALVNLLGNAFKFTLGRDPARIEVGLLRQDGQDVFFVRDNGAGFDMAYVDKLFKPFERLHAMKEFPGTGVGLASVQRVIVRHGGRAWAEGKPDQGATFYFTLGGAART